jgi:hypothetical protein
MTAWPVAIGGYAWSASASDHYPLLISSPCGSALEPPPELEVLTQAVRHFGACTHDWQFVEGDRAAT